MFFPLLFEDRLIGLPEGRARNHNRPQQVPALSGILVQDIAVGAEHTLVLTSTGDVYTWGSNSEGQVTYTHTHTHTEQLNRLQGCQSSCNTWGTKSKLSVTSGEVLSITFFRQHQSYLGRSGDSFQ